MDDDHPFLAFHTHLVALLLMTMDDKKEVTNSMQQFPNDCVLSSWFNFCMLSANQLPKTPVGKATHLLRIHQYIALGNNVEPDEIMEEIIAAIKETDLLLLTIAEQEQSPTNLPPPPPPPLPHVIYNNKALYEALANLDLGGYSGEDEDWKKWKKHLKASLGL